MAAWDRPFTSSKALGRASPLEARGIFGCAPTPLSVELPRWRCPNALVTGLSGKRLLGLGLELQAHAVHAVAPARRRRSIIEHVAEVASAAPAVDLCASSEQALVDAGGHRIFEGCIEARPAGAAVELGLRREQGKIAPRTQVGAMRILLVKGAAPCALRAVFAQDIELLAGELFAPLLLALGDLECPVRCTLAPPPSAPHLGP